jgi:hypothetical protein
MPEEPNNAFSARADSESVSYRASLLANHCNRLGGMAKIQKSAVVPPDWGEQIALIRNAFIQNKTLTPFLGDR